MNLRSNSLLAAALLVAGGAPLLTGRSCAAVPIVPSPAATPVERTAAQDLAEGLSALWPEVTFPIAAQLPEEGPCVLLGSDADIRSRVRSDPPAALESFTIMTIREGPRELGLIAGADSRGTAHGVYSLLRKLGWGFYLSGDTRPPAQTKPFSFAGWQLADRPLVRERLVFNWHNFLSGCSTWNLPDWQKWITQSHKMGYNAVMVHAYGNNPMFSFEFEGRVKPVGYLSTTAKGRDWSTMHVNDVRRLWGGSVFNGPAFGSDAALVPDDGRAQAAQQLMREVFAHARQRAMSVYFALDVDTASANPQELIRALPAEARFAANSSVTAPAGGESGRLWLANPDHPAGYRYYRAQAASLLKTYPALDHLVIWFRNDPTPWMGLGLAELPPSWQQEFRAEIARTPEAEKFWKSHNIFALGKVVRAFERALRELGNDRVQVDFGTWRFTFLPAADRFLPRHTRLIGLDYEVLHDQPVLGDAESRRGLREVGAHRPIVPVLWAHHDDGHYLGRPYTPLSGLQARLADVHADGFGIIHWTTRPLDLYFTSLIDQVWLGSKDLPLPATCASMAERLFGVSSRPQMGEYLHRWITTAPRFARETSDFFIDRQLTNIHEITAACRKRLNLIAAVDRNALTAGQRDRLDYHRGLEEFIAGFHQAHDRYQRSRQLLQAGELNAAREAMTDCQPERVIEQFAHFSSLGGITRGEQGLVVSLNTRWLTHIVRHRQALGLEPVRINFAPTQHDKLAQSRGAFTFHFDTRQSVWQTLGAEETGVLPSVLSAQTAVKPTPGIEAEREEIFRSGLSLGASFSLPLRPIMTGGNRTTTRAAGLPAGRYSLHLLLLQPAEAADAGVLEVAVASEPGGTRHAFEPVTCRFLRIACRGNSENDWNSIEEVQIGTPGRESSAPAVTASAAVAGFPATHAADGKPETRWAARGTNQWIQFELDPRTATDHVDIRWYQADKRTAQFQVLASMDGRQWSPVNPSAPDTPRLQQIGHIEMPANQDRAYRAHRHTFPIALSSPGQATAVLTPRLGQFRLCGVILEPVLPTTASRGGRPSRRRRHQRGHALPFAHRSDRDPNSRRPAKPNQAGGHAASHAVPAAITKNTQPPCPARSIVVVS